MDTEGFFGLLKTPVGVDLVNHGETFGDVLDSLNTTSNSTTVFVGIINLSTLELVHVGDRFRNSEHIAKKLIIEAYNSR